MSRETVALRDPVERRARVILGAVRLMAAVVASLLAAVAAEPARSLGWLVPAAMCGGLALAQRERSWLWRGAVVAEIVVAAFGVPVTGGPESALLPYLLGPLFAVGFRSGAQRVVAAGLLATAVLGAGLRHDLPDERAYVVSSIQWTVLAVAFGLLAAWARALLDSDDPASGYLQVSRLLAELRGVARRLPGSLDPVSAAETLLDECAEVTSFDRAGVLLASSTERLTPLVVRGAERLDLDTRTSGDGHVAQAWRDGCVVRDNGRDVRSGMASLLVVPVLAQDECNGVVVLESAAPHAFPDAEAQAVGRLVLAAAPRLESSLLFDEIRRIATVEERQRVAREIHDGIAQELVYVGYELDALGSDLDAKRPTSRDSVRRVREHVTRIISELRLSIFTLRTAPEPGGLGAALGEYVRSVASAAGIAVHLSLSEDATRLPADAEAELLRIAQEAVSNARKHAGARNLWVTLHVDPPRAYLRVEDDGTGIDGAGRRGFGLDIMRERAERLGAELRVVPRDPRGTAVEVEVGGGA
ncbi:MAG TPA: GAF domain-containing sensor histidine kinase [Mycobacteriales bacterium]